MPWKWLVIAAVISGCSSAKKNEVGEEIAQQEQDKAMLEFEKANRLLDDAEFEKAAAAYDRLLVDHPASQLDLVILFNSGLAHLQSGDCMKASERFRKSIRISKEKYPNIAGRALLRMGDVHICLGEDTKAIANLLQIYQGKYSLSEEITYAEAPAKLAAVYARLGNRREAEKYFRAAERGLLRVIGQVTDPIKRNMTLARTLFLMGNIGQLNIQTMTAEDYLTTLRALQKYLYKSVEFDAGKPSKDSYEQIIMGYEQVWTFIDRVSAKPTKDTALAIRSVKTEKLRISQLTLQNIRELYNERIPDPNESAIIKELMNRVGTQEVKFRNYIAKNIIGTSLTPEALAAEGVKRSGRVYNPDPILEQKAVKRKMNAP